MQLPVWTVDAFTDQPFSGNPAAVCLLEQDIPDRLKQALATEMNISETCFLTLLPGATKGFKGESHFGLRWFTPTNEVPLCGHATLAAATVLFRAAGNANDLLHFETLSGELTAEREEERVVLDLPLNPHTSLEGEHFQALAAEAACGLPIQEVLLNRETRKLLVRLEDGLARAQLEAIRPNSDRLLAAENSGRVAGVILTLRARAEDKEDFFSRYFAPWNGIPEDPVTGSAHTVLAPYWASELEKKQLVARQVSPRGGELHLKMVESLRLRVAGQAVVVLQGNFNLP